jgi:hypothetical protein
MSFEVPIIILILAIPFYFLSRWVFKKIKLGNEQNRKYLAIIPTVIITPLLYVGIVLIGMFSMTYYPNIDFDKQKWEENQEKRYKMSKDIIKSEVLIGKTKAEVIELLGEDYHTYDEDHIAYDLGFVPELFNIDPDVLDIYFENGIVVKVGQHRT